MNAIQQHDARLRRSRGYTPLPFPTVHWEHEQDSESNRQHEKLLVAGKSCTVEKVVEFGILCVPFAVDELLQGPGSPETWTPGEAATKVVQT